VERPVVGSLCTLVLLFGLRIATADVTPAPVQLVENTTQKMLSALRADHEALKRHPQRLYQLVQSIVLPQFDFERMSRLVLGRYWRTATPEQQRRFVQEFRQLLVRTYATSLLDYTNQKVTMGPYHAPPGAKDVTVHSDVERPGAMPLPIDYRMHLKDGQWTVYDVTVDGVSLVTNYRASFASEIQQQGLDHLINALASRNREGRA
jgi:phospholipid transport system substrate-binding protein